jgi:negative regulator of flagellin synthesis FlgM
MIKSIRKPIVKVDSTTRNGTRSLADSTARTQQGDSASPALAGGASSSGAPAAGAGSLGGDANVSLSSLSSTLRSLAASGAADIDMAHVQSIKDAIANGTLQIDTGKIADGVLETARSLLKPASGN